MSLRMLTRSSTVLRRICCLQRVTPAFQSLKKLDINPQTLGNHNYNFSSQPPDFVGTQLLDLVTFESVCSDTLESLCDYFEDIVENDPKLQSPDITYSDGVLTIKLGKPHGTYVINRQTPNRQIWLSSPTSGPKRYDFVAIKTQVSEGFWLYRHDGVTLHELLQNEIKEIISSPVDFLELPHSQKK